MFGQLYQLDFTSAGLPRDEDITISFELPDGEESPELTNKFLDWVFAKGVFPDSDYTFYAPDNERLKAVKKAAINLREKEKAAKKDPAHNCGDINCPHGNELAFERIKVSRMLFDMFKLDFTKWEPFKYPIISIGSRGLMRISDMLFSIYDSPRAFRIMYHKTLKAENGDKSICYKIPRDFNFVEAVYFPVETCDFELMSNSSGIRIHPERKYNFTYMIHQGRMTELSLEFSAEEVHFALIAWVFMESNICRNLHEGCIISTVDEKVKTECREYITRIM